MYLCHVFSCFVLFLVYFSSILFIFIFYSSLFFCLLSPVPSSWSSSWGVFDLIFMPCVLSLDSRHCLVYVLCLVFVSCHGPCFVCVLSCPVLSFVFCVFCLVVFLVFCPVLSYPCLVLSCLVFLSFIILSLSYRSIKRAFLFLLCGHVCL